MFRWCAIVCNSSSDVAIKMWSYLAQSKINGNVGNYMQRVKIVINDNIIEQVTYIKYLG